MAQENQKVHFKIETCPQCKTVFTAVPNNYFYDEKKDVSFCNVNCYNDSKKRKSVEHNAFEMVMPFCLTNPQFKDATTVLTNITNELFCVKIKFNTQEDRCKYIKKIFEISFSMLDKYIKILHEIIKDNPELDNTHIRTIFISGKKNKHPEIDILNIGIDNKAAKADFYIQFTDYKIIGISVKQNKKATKSNYSIEKLFDDETVCNTLSDIRKNYLNENGFMCFDIKKRKQMNALFYRQEHIENPYWKELKNQISINKQKIIDKFLDGLFSSIVPYFIYEFDGEKFIHLNGTIIDKTTVTFEEYEPYYLTKNGKKRAAAKLFYRLVVNDTKRYRVEIRWKGDIYNSSPQLLTHEDI